MNNAPLAPQAPRCEYQINPLGLDELCPRFYWRVTDPRRGAVQSAYRVLIASDNRFGDGSQGDVWDSGKIASDQCSHVEYGGPALRSGQCCYWKVRTWDAQDEASPWSVVQWFEMGLLRATDWRAKWVAAAPFESAQLPGAPGAPGGVTDLQQVFGHTGPLPSEAMRCPLVRKVVALASRPVRARLYVTARGLYEFQINGRRIAQDAFTPGWTDYRKRIQYQTYDVTDALQAGDNALGAILANGWYCGHVAWKSQVYGRQPSLLAQLHVELSDGTSRIIVTDGSWKTAYGPIVESDMLMGETYDARREMPGWAAPGFDDSNWLPVAEQVLDDVPLVASAGPRVQAMERLKPIAITQPQVGHIVFDLGQNMVGCVRLTVPLGTPAGTTITLRHAEVLNPDGTPYYENLRKARATDVYVCRGTRATEDPEVFEPRFTFHGFRYVELIGFPATGNQGPGNDVVTGVVMHSATPPAGTFECSDPLINQLQHNIVWGQKGNFLEVPTDCPQRNERLGWMGDAQVFVRTACFNMDTAGFFTKWLIDVEDSQCASGAYPMVAPDAIANARGDGGPGWADAGIIVPWNIYLCYGDRRVLERHYASMARYAAFLTTVDPQKRHNFGDWLHHDAPTPYDLIAVAFHVYSLDLLSRIAGVLGKKRDAAKYGAAARRVRTLFSRHFVTPEGRVLGDSQTAYVLALHFDLLPEKLRAKAAGYLVHDIENGKRTNIGLPRKGHLSTGFLGTRDLPFALSNAGHLDMAYKLLFNEGYPSWLFPVKNGATTIWERWDGWTPDKGFQDPGMNSFNHYAYGAIGQWLYQVVAGLDLGPGGPPNDGAGYRRLRIEPHPPGNRRLTWAKAAYQSIHGYIESSWKIENDRFILDVLIPANTSGTVVLPSSALEGITESGFPLAQAQGLSNPRVENGRVVFDAAAGIYRFECPLP